MEHPQPSPTFSRPSASRADVSTQDRRPHSKHVRSPPAFGSPPSRDEPRRASSTPGTRYVCGEEDTAEDDSRINEQSPLLPAQLSGDVGKVPDITPIFGPDRSSGESSWDADVGTREESKSSWYLFLLTLSFGGLQMAWSVELSNGSPYLLSLGITKSLLAIVWIAGPLSGTLVQPYVGIKSDRCRSRFGKRRPFMIGGAFATITSLMLLAWTREIISGTLSLFGFSKDSQGTKITTIVFAVLMIYILDFSINVIQAGIRAFVVDNAPTHQQDSANAWASRLLGAGNIVGYLFGYANLPEHLWFFGTTQFQVLCAIASLAMATTLAISCFCVSERDPRLEGEPAKHSGGVVSFSRDLYVSVHRLPPQIKNVCLVQLAAWIGWFPFLFYLTTYVGELHVDPIFRNNPNMTDNEIDDAWEQATRVGTFALLVYAITSFAASIVLPWFIASTYKAPEARLRTPLTISPTTSRTSETTGAARIASSGSYAAYQPAGHQTGTVSALDADSLIAASTRRKRAPQLECCSLEVPWLTLKRAWLLSHLMVAMLTWLTFFVHDTTAATVLAGFLGIPWAMTMWAPFALIAAEVSKQENMRRGIIRPPPTRGGDSFASGEDASEGTDQAGVVLGIHNVAIAAPQVVATLVSSAIFKALQKPRGVAGDDSVAWVLRFGGLLALVAAWLTRRIAEEGDEEGTLPKW